MYRQDHLDTDYCNHRSCQAAWFSNYILLSSPFNCKRDATDRIYKLRCAWADLMRPRWLCCDEATMIMLWWGHDDCIVMRPRWLYCDEATMIVLWWGHDDCVVMRPRWLCYDEAKMIVLWWGDDDCVVMRRRRLCCDEATMIVLW